MSCFPWLSFDPKLTWDGLLTFFGGVLAFFAIRLQVRHSDRGLQKQLDAEKQAREEETKARRLAVATALLFEIDHVYRQYVRDVWEYFKQRDKEKNSDLPVFWPVGAERLAVYRENAGQFGDLLARLVSTIVEWYGSVQSHLAQIAEYSRRYAIAVKTKTQSDILQATSMLPQIKDNCQPMADRTFFACGLLCQYTGIEFASPAIAVASDAIVSTQAHAALAEALKSYGPID